MFASSAWFGSADAAGWCMTATTAPPMPQILVATDFSDSAEAAFGVALDYARRLHARVRLMHVFSEGEFDVTRLLADAAARAEPDVPVTVTGTGGDPAEEILRYASRQPIDLIVVGTHGRSGVSRLLLGSVAERVLRGARCPVLVVPAPRTSVMQAPESAAAGAAVAGAETEDDEQREERAGRA